MINYDLSPLLKKTYIGFDNLQNFFDSVSESNFSYPPYNIEDCGDFYKLTMAVAGFKISNLDIEVKENFLIVSGKKEKSKDSLLWKGISDREFSRKFILTDDLEVNEASLEDGLLTVTLTKKTQEPVSRKIKISKN